MILPNGATVIAFSDITDLEKFKDLAGTTESLMSGDMSHAAA